MRGPPLLRLVAVAALTAALATAPASRAIAHTDFDFSLPTDGAVVPEPVDEITIGFTLPVTLVGNGFEVLDPQGKVLEPFAVTDDDTVFRLQLDPPIAGGEAAVRYEVRAEDGHTLTGGFRFTVDAPVPTTAVTVAPTTAAPATATPTPATSPDTAPTTPTVVPTAPTSVADVGAAPSSVAPAVATVTSTTSVSGDDDDGSSSQRLLVGAAGVVALGAAGFLFLRSRATGAA